MIDDPLPCRSVNRTILALMDSSRYGQTNMRNSELTDQRIAAPSPSPIR